MTASKIISCFIVCLILGCQFNSQELYVIQEINIGRSQAENAQIGKDLCSYDYSRLILDSLKIKDNTVLKDIAWQYFIQSDNKNVSFRLILKNRAREHDKELVTFFENFVKSKLHDYKTHENTLDSAVVESLSLITLLNDGNFDSLLTKTSPKLLKFGTKIDFRATLDERNAIFKPTGTPKVSSRLLFDNFGKDLDGEFYVIYFEYRSKEYEQFTLEKTGDKFTLVGYRFFIPRNNNA